jgi:ABC-type dipeptide/oligopeptide/nickel transport system permease component
VSRGFTRLALGAARAIAVVALTGAATVALVEWAPGARFDERAADASLGAQTRTQIAAAANQRQWLSGHSAAFDRPVSELVSHRWRTTVRAAATGLALAWGAALMCAAAGYSLASPLWSRLSALLSTVLLSLPASLVALAVFLQSLNIAWAVACVLFPIVYGPLRNRFAAAAQAWDVVGAEARGVPRWTLAVRHILLPARAEWATLVALSVKWALSAAVPAEVFGNAAGLGQLMFQAAEARDIALLLPLTLGTAALVQVAQLAASCAGAEPGPLERAG